MPAALAMGPVQAALLDALKASGALTAIVPIVRMADNFTTTPVKPYVLVEGGDEVPFNTMGGATLPKWGGVATVRVRVVSDARTDREAQDIQSLVRAALDGQPLTVAGFPTAIVEFDRVDMLKDNPGGVTTRELVATYRVTAHQSA